MTKKTKAQVIKEKQKSPPPLKRYISFIIAHQYIDKIFRVLTHFRTERDAIQISFKI